MRLRGDARHLCNVRCTHWAFDLTCPGCGADVRQRAAGTTSGRATQAIVDCTECPSSWLVTVSLESVRAAQGQYDRRKKMVVS